MEKSKLEDLREEIIKLSKLIDQKLMILTNVNCNDTEFLKSIQNDFSQNLYFILYITIVRLIYYILGNYRVQIKI